MLVGYSSKLCKCKQVNIVFEQTLSTSHFVQFIVPMEYIYSVSYVGPVSVRMPEIRVDVGKIDVLDLGWCKKEQAKNPDKFSWNLQSR
jgi:hypothetical protein